MSSLSRRDFLKITRDGLLYLSGALALAGVLRFLNFQTPAALRTEFDLGPAENYPLGARAVLAGIPAILIHSEQGFSAISLVCTHLGCSVGESEDGFTCPCHGSRFDAQGHVLHGPANEALESLHIEQTPDGHLHLFTS